MYCTRLRNQSDVNSATYGYVMCRRLQTLNFLLTRGVIAARLKNTYFGRHWVNTHCALLIQCCLIVPPASQTLEQRQVDVDLMYRVCKENKQSLSTMTMQL